MESHTVCQSIRQHPFPCFGRRRNDDPLSVRIVRGPTAGGCQMVSETVFPASFLGWRVVAGTFVLAVFGWGVGFYGPPVYLHAVQDARGWPLGLVSTAVTVHFLFGAVVVANLPALYRQFGVPAITKAGALSLAVGVCGWATAAAPWQLFAATLLSGAGWVAMSA